MPPDHAAAKTVAPDDDDSALWYFAIGAMINPISLKSRKIHSIASLPAEIQDYRLHFFGSLGFAEAIPEAGASFHGVLHRLDSKSMEILDNVERDYVRKNALARCYDGTEVDCTVYVRPKLDGEGEKDMPPKERYLEIMVEGCKHYKVDERHIRYLSNHEMQPRPKPSEFLSFGAVPNGAPLMTPEQVKKCNGKDGTPLYVTVNGKVLECTAARDTKAWQDFVSIHSHFGQSFESLASKVTYDPKYGQPGKLQDFTREHSAYCEDQAYRYQKFTGLDHVWKPIAHYPQEYVD